MQIPDLSKKFRAITVDLPGYGWSEQADTLSYQLMLITFPFGKEAYCGYSVSNKNEDWWFNNIDSPNEPNQPILTREEQASLKAKLLQLHKNDPAPIIEIITTAEQISCYPIYDISFLKQ